MAKTNGAASNVSGLNTTAPLGSLVTGSAGSMSGQRQGNVSGLKILLSCTPIIYFSSVIIGIILIHKILFLDSPMVDEMFDGPGGQMDVVDSEDSVMTGPVSSLLSELTANERTVHADFYNNFGDLFDDKDLN